MKKRILATCLLVTVLTGCSVSNPASNPPENALQTSETSTHTSKGDKGLLTAIGEDIDKLVILADIGGITVKQGDRASVSCENVVMDWVAVENADGTMKVTYQPPTPESIKDMDTSSHQFTVTLPNNHAITNVELNTGTGTMVVDNLITNSLTLAQGTGNMEINDVQASDIAIECGTGEIVAKGIIAKQATQIHMGTGTLALSGDFSGMLCLEGGTGDATLNFSQPKENYTITGESFVRKISIDGEAMKNQGDSWEDFALDEDEMPLTSTKKETQPTSESRHSIKIDGGTGKVSLNFGSK